ncbi:SDR family NAD(P)-dependent oxidoreductase [Leptolyngbya sp. 7M]|uniref:SDR family NAD(P)-dependent oxidoreductase n=1 Tax=Leptolyngbya sp. 7M TaxID=2812896 RepID=UPI001B8D7A91|nr:SDR family NAD(P)-dependent oxidoreductase [Leptolyngbya sp. 7M]QYO67569.1 SDR family NAD(P)-dependent oxidoreductase [Leptolyngbya sp. 7M]
MPRYDVKFSYIRVDPAIRGKMCTMTVPEPHINLPSEIFAGKTAIVTGASRGVGRATAIRLAEGGANVVVNYLQNHSEADETVRLCGEKGVRAIAVQGDVSQYSAAAEVAKRTVEEFGGIDLLVLNAGIWEGAPIEEMTEDTWNRVLNTNLKSVLAGTDDTITPAVSQQFLPFTQLKGSKFLLTAIGGTHLSVGDPANLNHVFTQSLFIRERPEQETEALRQLLRGVSLAFVQQLTPEANRYAPFLTAAYAQSFSSTELKLRLNSQLPPNFPQRLRMAALPMEQLISSTLAKGKAESQQGVCYNKLNCLLGGLPLVMFILPGGVPLAANQFFRWRRKAAVRDSVDH